MTALLRRNIWAAPAPQRSLTACRRTLNDKVCNRSVHAHAPISAIRNDVVNTVRATLCLTLLNVSLKVRACLQPVCCARACARWFKLGATHTAPIAWRRLATLAALLNRLRSSFRRCVVLLPLCITDNGQAQLVSTSFVHHRARLGRTRTLCITMSKSAYISGRIARLSRSSPTLIEMRPCRVAKVPRSRHRFECSTARGQAPPLPLRLQTMRRAVQHLACLLSLLLVQTLAPQLRLAPRSWRRQLLELAMTLTRKCRSRHKGHRSAAAATRVWQRLRWEIRVQMRKARLLCKSLMRKVPQAM